MCKEELNQVEEIEEVEQEEYVDSSEEIMGQIAVQEELKRIDIQENPTSEVSEETLSSDFYKDSMITVETIGEAFLKLIGFGIDYNNSVSIANNVYQNAINERLTKIQQVQVEQNNV